MTIPVPPVLAQIEFAKLSPMNVASFTWPIRSTAITSPSTSVSMIHEFWPPTRPSLLAFLSESRHLRRAATDGSRPSRRDLPAGGFLLCNVPLSIELVIKAVTLAHGPRLLDRDFFHPREDVVGHLRASIGEPVTLPTRRIFNQVFPGEDGHLRCRRRDRREGTARGKGKQILKVSVS